MEIVSWDNMRILGRIAVRDGITYLGNTGSGMEVIAGKGKVTACMVTEPEKCENPDTAAYLGIYLNDSDEPFRIIRLDKPEGEYTLFFGKEETVVRVFKLTEASQTNVGIKAVYADTAVRPTAERELKIEFIGDSYTCGYGNVTDRPEDGFRTCQEYGYAAYSALTARILNADFSVVATSGIGVLSSWTGENKINDGHLMSDVYPYESRYVDNLLGRTPQEWDFGRFVPHIITVFLGTNDSSYIGYDPDIRFPLFREKYIAFVRDVAKRNPKSKILCLMGVGFDGNSRMYGEVRQASEQLAAEGYAVVSYCMKKCDFELDGIGGSYHPTWRSHRKMATELAGVIRKLLKK